MVFFLGGDLLGFYPCLSIVRMALGFFRQKP